MKTILILLSLSLSSFTYAWQVHPYGPSDDDVVNNNINRVVSQNTNGECEVYNRDSGQTESCNEEEANFLNNIQVATAQTLNDQTTTQDLYIEPEKGLRERICDHSGLIAGISSSIAPFGASLYALSKTFPFKPALVGVGALAGASLAVGLIALSVVAVTAGAIIFFEVGVPMMNNLCPDDKIIPFPRTVFGFPERWQADRYLD